MSSKMLSNFELQGDSAMNENNVINASRTSSFRSTNSNNFSYLYQRGNRSNSIQITHTTEDSNEMNEQICQHSEFFDMERPRLISIESSTTSNDTKKSKSKNNIKKKFQKAAQKMIALISNTSKNI